ncbi:MAG: polar amino acid ABC transporter ATP-binding protein [Bdellovibrionales bacterium CG12_big_fil_rev_8_21_14_0_65_38_15]|nr:MAG: polar amino acid ABC transporter ATP-binding protein [Bdellovibrionales bacterium CG22_combo_CG10-13_8_21_14_all_38_13]PIQ53377.1 MAG: polar amino acid ABC transporter ATP-binding protein [Bdellovibrionales bacterium CG12_big_fil_rev_8_21_14_0_65_38_15]PIR30260.1 MAG: polar amino acid ABC transporter ATP-binding protein [Bdellovibrionales bacterium CG11_big_fil_rev_8_21_14_0_20_38_13]
MALLSAQNIHKNFGQLEVLKGIDLEVQAGEVICLIGASGSGKSTFLRCLNYLELPTDGIINYQGTPIDPKVTNLNQVRSSMGMVFQHFNLFPHMSVLENIIEAPIKVQKIKRSEAIQIANRLLEKVGLSDKAKEYPARLSGGQKQRVAIARALAMDPKLMLFDEPTSALDPETVESVLNVMKQLVNDGMTMIIVTHEISFARAVADRICFLHEGKILEEGSPCELLDSPKNARTQEFLKSVIA